jgi:hypothetical protein
MTKVQFLAGIEKGFFSLFATASRPALGPTQFLVQWVLGVLSPEVKLPECENYHSSPASVMVKNAWSYTSTSSYVFMAWCLIKQRIYLHRVVLS